MEMWTIESLNKHKNRNWKFISHSEKEPTISRREREIEELERASEKTQLEGRFLAVKNGLRGTW